MNISHLGSLETKTFKNVHDVWKVVQGGTSVPKPIWLDFRSRKMMKIYGRVYNMCLSWFMVKTFGYESLSTNPRSLRRSFARGVEHCLSSVYPQKRTSGMCVDRRDIDDNCRPTLRNFFGGAYLHSLWPNQWVCSTEEGPVVHSQTDRQWGLVYEGPIFLHVLT